MIFFHHRVQQAPYKVLRHKFHKKMNFSSMDQEEKMSQGFGLFTFSIEVKFLTEKLMGAGSTLR